MTSDDLVAKALRGFSERNKILVRQSTRTYEAYVLPVLQSKNPETTMQVALAKENGIDTYTIQLKGNSETSAYVVASSDFNAVTPTPDSIDFILQLAGQVDMKREDGVTAVPLVGIKGTPEKLPVIYVEEKPEGFIVTALMQENQLQVVDFSSIVDMTEIRAVMRAAGSRKTTNTASVVASDKKEIVWEDPQTIIKYLQRSVIGQQSAMETVAVAFSNYMVRMQSDDEDLPKENIIIIGPTGSGKTFMTKLLARKAGLPQATTNLSGKSAEGYKGQNLSMFFSHLRKASTDDAPHGIVYLDEFDKMVPGRSNSAFDEDLQDEVIGWSEESIINFDTRTGESLKPLNTRNILFVGAGAFHGAGDSNGLQDIVKTRLQPDKTRMGFGVETAAPLPTNLMEAVRPEDLIKYGLKFELVGRFPIIAALEELTLEQKTLILRNSENSILRRYTRLLAERGYRLTVENGVHELIAGHAPKETGARSLNAVCADIFTEIFLQPNKYTNAAGRIILTPALTSELITTYRSTKKPDKT